MNVKMNGYKIKRIKVKRYEYPFLQTNVLQNIKLLECKNVGTLEYTNNNPPVTPEPPEEEPKRKRERQQEYESLFIKETDLPPARFGKSVYIRRNITTASRKLSM